MSSTTPVFGDLVDVKGQTTAREPVDLTPYVSALRMLLAHDAGAKAIPVTPGHRTGYPTIRKRFNEALGTLSSEYPYARLIFRKENPKDSTSRLFVKWARTGEESLLQEVGNDESGEGESTTEQEETPEVSQETPSGKQMAEANSTVETESATGKRKRA